MPYYNTVDGVELLQFMTKAYRLVFEVTPSNGGFYETQMPFISWLNENATGNWRFHMGDESKDYEFVLLTDSAEDYYKFAEVFAIKQ